MTRAVSVALSSRPYIGVHLVFQPYLDPAGGMAVRLLQDREHGDLATASVNLAGYGYTPSEGCVFLKSYSENSGLLESLLRAGVVEQTGRYAHVGFVDVPEVRFINEWADSFAKAEKTGRKDRIKMLREIQ